MDDDRLPFSQAIEVGRRAAEGVENGAPLTIGVRRADDRDREIATPVRREEDPLAFGFVVRVAKDARTLPQRLVSVIG
jgi:hypothetical protein